MVRTQRRFTQSYMVETGIPRRAAASFTEAAVTDFDSAKTSDTAMFSAYFGQMLDQGVYLPPSQFEACFVSIAHTTEDLDKTIRAAREALAGVQ